MALYIANSSSEVVWVAVIYPSGGCAGQQFKKIGWYELAPLATIIPNARSIDTGAPGNYVASIYAANMGTTHEWPVRDAQSNYFTVDLVNGFDVCIDDVLPNQVEFAHLHSAGSPHLTAYIGPEIGQVRAVAPAVFVTPGHGSIFVSGRGFAANTQVDVSFNYFDGGGVTSNTDSPQRVGVFGDGSFSTIISVSTLISSGHIDVQAVDVFRREVVAKTGKDF